MPITKLVDLVWQDIDGYNSVAKVHGGWIVKNVEDVWQLDDQATGRPTGGFTASMVFVPDEHHEWEMETLIGIHD